MREEVYARMISERQRIAEQFRAEGEGESARINGIPKVVFASTNHVSGFYEKEGVFQTPDMPIRPDSMYGVSKAYGETLGYLYASEFGVQFVAVRIGNFNSERPEPGHPHHLGVGFGRVSISWVGHRWDGHHEAPRR